MTDKPGDRERALQLARGNRLPGTHDMEERHAIIREDKRQRIQRSKGQKSPVVRDVETGKKSRFKE